MQGQCGPLQSPAAVFEKIPYRRRTHPWTFPEPPRFPRTPMSAPPAPDTDPRSPFPATGGECAGLLRAIDWSRHALGDPRDWPPELKTAVRTTLSSHFPMMVHWGERLHTFYNDAYAVSLGHKHPGHLGEPARDWWSEMWDQLEPFFAKVLAGESFYTEDARYTPDRDGAPREAYFTHCHSPIWDDEGRVQGIFLVVTETTRLVLAEQGRMREERRNRQILDSARDYAIISFSLDGLVTSWNEGACAVLGWTEEEMLGQPPDRFFTPEDNAQGRPQEEMRQALDHGSASGERWHLRKDGQRFWASGEVTPLRDEAGQVQGFVKILRDRTEHERLNSERDKAVRELGLLNDNLKTLVAEQAADRDRIWHLSTDLMDVCDASGRLLAVNDAWGSTLGWPEEVLLRTNFLDLVHPDDREPTIAELQRLDAGHTTKRFENRFRCRDGSYRVISWVAQPFEQRFYATGRDVTDQRRVEEQLRQSQKMEAIGQLTGGIAHDFNNLLATIISSLQLLQRKLAPVPEARGAERYIAMAGTAAQRAASLVHRLLAFSRKQTLDLQHVDANALVLGMEEMLRRTLGENIRLWLSLAPGPGRVRSDRNQLENALLNLCINARDAMEHGGRLTIETSTVVLDRLYANQHPHLEPGRYVRLTVADSGTGMPPEVVAKAFDPFFTTKPIGQGTGLGLSMIYGFARQTGGHVAIESRVGEGTSVSLYLPAVAEGAPPVPIAPPATADLPRGRGETLLFVEDEPGLRAILGEVLTDLEYVAHEAVDAPSALAVMDALGAPDLLITDVGLPGMGGRQLADVARRRCPDLKVLFITGYANEASVRSEFLGPGMDMMAKPFTIEALACKVRQMLD